MKDIYNTEYIENDICNLWDKKKDLIFNKSYKKDNFSIILPPPNITGILHIGHSYQQSIMDLLIRYNKMKGKNVLWQYGIDHAGIATQILIEKKINLYKNSYEIKKEKNKFLIKEAWIWKNKIKKKLDFQMKRIGNLINFSNYRFTLDKKFNYSVKYAFIKLYNNNFIYKDKKITNWDTNICSAISDLEISHKESLGEIWNIKFPILDKNFKYKNNNNFIIVSTTRPETILGDSAIAVHPNDNRYTHLIGKNVLVPIVNRIIPIIYDESIDMNKETGCVKITPAHNFNDYKIGFKNLLPIINIFNKNGNINKFLEITYFNKSENSLFLLPDYLHNINILKARKIIINELINLNLLYSSKIQKIIIPYSNRSNSIVENLITNQWFLKTKELSQQAINIVKNKEIVFIPKKYENMYFDWMNNIEDWCISRQIWWGHKIPAWYDLNNNIYVGFNEEEIRKKNDLSKSFFLKKENDVLDTWFSSSLFTFSSLGWPKNTKMLKKFHPTNIIISGFDIIYFWISRMIMITLYLIKNKKNISQVPFNKVYITGLISDEIGNKMSKSYGNVIDPIDIINGISLENLIIKKTNNIINEKEKNKIISFTKKKFPNGIESYGADALRFSFISLSYSNNRNIIWNLNIVKEHKKFCNKLWNASKFVFKNTKDHLINENIKFNKLKININKWILIKLNNLIEKISNEISNYRLDIYAKLIYEFIWNEFCNWYIEFTKILLKEKEINKLNETKNILINILINILKISHPIIPFITEKIWQEIYFSKENNNLIILQKFPEFNLLLKDKNCIKYVDIIKNIISTIRNIKSKFNNINYNLIINTKIKNNIKIINKNRNIILKLTNINNIFINNFNYKNNNLIYKKNIYDIEIIILT